MALETARRVLEIEAAALQDLVRRLDGSFVRAVETLFACRGRVVVAGMGKSGLIGQKISATFGKLFGLVGGAGHEGGLAMNAPREYSAGGEDYRLYRKLRDRRA